ncbi:SDR family oxidoreductase [Streptomyces sp. H10-C2]|uniref:SDR family oxidoreductase n=1 Tax=unclassified Streptomyces TaxID=2593676 RepID=UPI0024B99D99|nr:MULTISPECIES: SDR family oxidoreductase [unclassified Streptomyces]MDJ0341587.1 SDR family oxidoreductase [Streptomyces sp. PH10-H1]MDJ0371311.1 SDR family oxidoreductase [Streptomyces sp. H10-C2]
MSERIVIVGGTSGIGLATAERQLLEGREVVVTGRDPVRLDAALERLGKGATGASVDARDEEAMRAFFGGLERIDHAVIAVTGATAAGPFSSIPAAALREAAEGKLIAQTIAAQAAMEVLRSDGSLTFVTAGSAGAAIPGTAGLAAVNAAVEAMVPVLAVELAPARVNAVSPGIIDTPWWDWLDPSARQQTFDAYAKAAPVGRVGRAQYLADAIAYLVDATFTSGVVLAVDGGSRLVPSAL